MFTIGLGQSLVFTSIPIFAREQGLNEVEVSLVFGVSAFAWFFMSPCGEGIAINLEQEL